MSFNFTHSTEHLANARVDFGGDTFKAVLVSSVPTTDHRNAWEYLSDVTNEISAGGGYTQGGFDVTATIGTLDTINQRLPITYTCASPTYTSSTISARGAIIYRVSLDSFSALEPTSSPVMHFVDFGSTKSSFDGNFTVTFPDPFYIRA
jgi:hypothetical protein